MNNQNFSKVAAFIWSVADLLRGDFRQSQYGRIILPFTLLRRLECVLEDTKEAVLNQHTENESKNLPESLAEKMLLRATKTHEDAPELAFYNTSPLRLRTLGHTETKGNLEKYIRGFSKDAREIFDYFNFEEYINLLDDTNLLYKVVEIFSNSDLSPEAISNHDMGLVFEELIRRFAESANDTAGEHFTPRDIIKLTTGLVFAGDDGALSQEGIIRTLYDPTAGTGGFLSAGMENVLELNPNAVIRTFGQELNAESYAICKADMLIKGQDVSLIKLGNTLSNDQLAGEHFDYMLSNPPFGVDWKRIESEIKDEHLEKGAQGRFGPGLPRVSDGSLLFLMHLISKMHRNPKQSSRIGIILNGSPLFTGAAGSGESEIRRHILESDLLEAIIALPTDMFYNTGIATYIWVLSNNKSAERKGVVQLVDASELVTKMRKSLGSKRNHLTDEAIQAIIQSYNDLADGEQQVGQAKVVSKQFAPHDFGYRRVTIERPLRLCAQLTDEAIALLRFAPRPFNAIMPALFEQYGEMDLSEHETEIRTLIKADYPELKERNIKALFEPKLWQEQRQLMQQAQTIKKAVGDSLYTDFNQFDKALKKALKEADIKWTAAQRRQFLEAVTWKNPDAEPVVKKVVKADANPMYGLFEYQGKVVEFEADGDLRDFENIPLNPSVDVSALVEDYVAAEVLPHVPDAWINKDRCDALDEKVGVVGYEIPFNRHFYVYEPPRDLAVIDAELDAVSQEIMDLLQEVHS